MRSGDSVTGLVFLPEGTINQEMQRQIQSAVHRLAKDRFRGPADTVDGMVYAVGSSATAKRYLLLLPYGDREQSMVNDTAIAYGLTLLDSSWTVSGKYAVALGVDREIHILEAADIDGDTFAEVLLCVRTKTGDRSVLALAFKGTELTEKSQSMYTPAMCPPGETLP
jgi:hypothetical protein